MNNYKLRINASDKFGETNININATKEGLLPNSLTKKFIIESPFPIDPTPDIDPVYNTEIWNTGEFKALVTKYPEWVGYYKTSDIRSYKFNANTATYTSTSWNKDYTSESARGPFNVENWGDNQEFAKISDGYIGKITIDLQNGDGPQVFIAHCPINGLATGVQKQAYRLFIPKDSNWAQKNNGRYVPDIVKHYMGERHSLSSSMMKIDASKPIGRLYNLEQSEYSGTPVFERGSLNFTATVQEYSTDTNNSPWYWWWGQQGPSTGLGYIKMTMKDGTSYRMPIYG